MRDKTIDLEVDRFPDGTGVIFGVSSGSRWTLTAVEVLLSPSEESLSSGYPQTDDRCGVLFSADRLVSIESDGSLFAVRVRRGARVGRYEVRQDELAFMGEAVMRTARASLRSFGHGVLNAEGTELRISLVSSPTEKLVLGEQLVPANCRQVSSPDGHVVAFLSDDGRILQYCIARGTAPGVLVLKEGADALVREQ